ncbi:ABC transporter ATP-binding protein [Pasteurella bettyae]|uniref:ABC transporter, ATP-binding protein n=1 Tax=Pasteurella bettyae CCUG 2042 TaxID=1095749 RepID=I3D7S0_9PAST|nr:ATP-binding cassette domain-containing protein [Pasteurella bettyae]EIJ67763.1 ABC transporter, ATP-binding protein [Pasteurella bettyae CCUG 2042]SUB22104.1 oligopeptide transport ATP-binding protein OppD [Pasteurella bettyae]
MTILIETQSLSVYTKSGLCLVEPINIKLQQGQCLTILGETGSGKSLLAQAIMGCLADGLIIKGQIHIHQDLINEKLRRQNWGKCMAMLPQEPVRSLDPTMNIFNQVWESFSLVGQLNNGLSSQKTTEKLTALGLAKFIKYFPHQLSGGMAQRASFAAATSGGAIMVIADEPTKGLDEKNKCIVIQLLQDIVNQGGTLLTITHDIDVAEQLGGSIMVMKKGILLEQGNAQQVLKNPQSEYAQQLMAASPHNWQKQVKQEVVSEILVTAKDLSLGRGERTLFKDLNFQLRKGEVLGLIGDSGIGKSSLGDALCGLLKPKCGEISWNFKPKRQQVLKLYQDPPAAFAQSVSLQILLDDVIDKHGLDRSKIPYLLTQLKLDQDLLARTANNVSGGELQRVAILRALLFEPVLLFADEVTSRLDPITQKETLDLLIEQCRIHNCTLVIVSHDHHLIEHYCHQIIDLTEYQLQ